MRRLRRLRDDEFMMNTETGEADKVSEAIVDIAGSLLYNVMQLPANATDVRKVQKEDGGKRRKRSLMSNSRTGAER